MASSPRRSASSDPIGDIQISEPTSRSSYTGRRNRKPAWQSPGVWIGGGFVLLAVFAGWFLFGRQPAAELTLKSIAAQTVNEGETLRIEPKWTLKGTRKSLLEFSLRDAPTGMKVSPKTGVITWKPTEKQGPNLYTFTLEVVKVHSPLSDSRKITVQVYEVPQAPVIPDIADLTTELEQPVSFTIPVTDPDEPAGELRFALIKGDSAGATINEQTGEFFWKPNEETLPGPQTFEVRATKTASAKLTARKRFTVHVTRPTPTDDPIVTALKERGATVEELTATTFSGFQGEGKQFRVNGAAVTAFRYETAIEVNADAAQVDADGAELFGEKQTWQSPAHFFKNDRYLVMYQGEDPEVVALLRSEFGAPFAQGLPTKTPPVTELSASDKEAATLIEYYQKERFFLKKEYPALRKLFADRFARDHASQIQSAFGDYTDEMLQWLAERPDIRDELYLAINPERDNIVAALSLFHQLKQQFPEQIEAYAQLAIAIAVTWDEERRGVYNYAQHQRRTKSIMPGNRLDAVGNFEYFIKSEGVMQGRAQFLPWEFLVLLVDHRTPAEERQWALQNYLKNRVMIGKCYHDVPYDYVMLETQSQECKLKGKDYTLANIKTQGGVCAMQADFAARVGKSLGVPAVYVGGEARSGELHAWVMWVELLNVTRNTIRFSLQSHGRYRGDKYYVGTLRDPQTGQQTTDRELELKLQLVGSDPLAKRQADLIMKAYPLILEKEQLDFSKQAQFLQSVIDLCPGHTIAWGEYAKLSKTPDLKSNQKRLLIRQLEKLFKTFAAFPDFTLTIFDDLVSFESDLRKKCQYYERVIQLYEAAARPDLASKARLIATDYYLQDKRTDPAVDGLAATILKFADEGRFVVGLLDRLEQICETEEIKGAQEKLITFYQQFLPKISRKRGNSPSKYCISMYQRGIKRFQTAGRNDLANILQNELAKIQNGR